MSIFRDDFYGVVLLRRISVRVHGMKTVKGHLFRI